MQFYELTSMLETFMPKNHICIKNYMVVAIWLANNVLTPNLSPYDWFLISI